MHVAPYLAVVLPASYWRSYCCSTPPPLNSSPSVKSASGPAPWTTPSVWEEILNFYATLPHLSTYFCVRMWEYMQESCLARILQGGIIPNNYLILILRIIINIGGTVLTPPPSLMMAAGCALRTRLVVRPGLADCVLGAGLIVRLTGKLVVRLLAGYLHCRLFG